MLIVRSPLRITLGGGGTDVPSYYQNYGGFCIAAAIDRFVHVVVHETFVDDLIVKYSELERVPDAKYIKHPIVREALGLLDMDGHALEIASHADIPAGTGLGSSSSFTTALLLALRIHAGNSFTKRELAEAACRVEITQLKGEIGKQDQYISAFGGLLGISFHTNGTVQAAPLLISADTRYDLEDNLVLFFTGYSRVSNDVISAFNTNIDVEDNLHKVKQLGENTLHALQSGDMAWFAATLTDQWTLKKERLRSASNSTIDNYHALGMRNGALGGKLVGAGGGGFLMFYALDKTSLRQAMAMAGLREVRFRFDFEGTKVVG